ncbi:MAG TPA: FAD-dependent monooxygenase [Chitinophagaceae bacterium]|jgi:flavin-dependent dehydrogenase|nr:FAD-dependent monooxygenase [Chitinophagaceae bacterium]
MTDDRAYYDVAIAGGGLAGLALSIQLARQGYSVILYEKEQYPFHKVCGEYISLESWDFLIDLGVDLDGMKVPVITELEVSAPNGRSLKHTLPLGGFGISRYCLDQALAKLAVKAGVVLKENTKLNDILFDGNEFMLEAASSGSRARIACAAYGKRSNIDIKWKRKFSSASKNKLNNYIGVKYHIKGTFPANTIALHNFKNGYCGIVKIEDDRYNLCYLTTADNLQKANGDIRLMEQTILSQNPHLREIFADNQFTSASPLTISQISFGKKSQVEDHVLMLGDAAGMITPLCGNGMSMALHGSKIAAAQIRNFLQGNITREKMEKRYVFQWQRQFAGRLRTGRRIQRLFGKNRLTALFLKLVKPFPGLVDWLVRKTHGKPF